MEESVLDGEDPEPRVLTLPRLYARPVALVQAINIRITK